MMLPKESAAFSSCRFNFFMVFLIPNSRLKVMKLPYSSKMYLQTVLTP